MLCNGRVLASYTKINDFNILQHVPGYEETTRRRNYISGYRNQQREPNDKSGRDGISHQGRFPEQGPTFVEQ